MKDEREDLLKWFNSLDLDNKYTIVNKIIYFSKDELMDVVINNCNIHILEGVRKRHTKSRRVEC